jgi:hypothetical protein
MPSYVSHRGGRQRPFSVSGCVCFARAGGSVEERFLGHRVRIRYDAERGSFTVEVPAEVEVVEGYWFAWAVFHPETSVFIAADTPAEEER